MSHPSPLLEWRSDEIPVSTQFDDPYYSLDHGLNETRHVFLSGNNLPDRFHDGLHIAELGFGTALNFLATLDLWRKTKQTGAFQFTTFEAFPMAPNDMIRAHLQFPEIAPLAQEFAPLWATLLETGQVVGTDYTLTIKLGDARDTVKSWDERADCWFLDGFSPAKNPELWDKDLLQAVANHTTDLGTVATYTAAGFVRRNLEAAGFNVKRIPGFGRKRHMTQAQKETHNAK